MKTIPITTNDGRNIIGSLTIFEDVAATLGNPNDHNVYTINREIGATDGGYLLRAISIGVLPVQPTPISPKELAYWKNLLTSRTKTLRERAERAEKRLKEVEDGDKKSWTEV